MRTTYLAGCAVILGIAASYACSTSGDGANFVAPGSASGGAPSVFARGGNSSQTGIVNPLPTGSIDMSKEPPTEGCGDGNLTKDEACDDGNTADGDGCLHNCRQVELGYSCAVAGEPCHQIARCGDSVKVFPELCDDGNTAAGDGCSPTCKYEIGYKCDGTPSVCTKTTCGDGKMEGAESCEDGNTVPFDGCSADCQNEPKCETGACTSSCGDGILLNEECDDGNNINGDGCSADCKPEPGFTCTQPPLGDMMKVPMVVRDFNAGGDFEKGNEFARDLNYANQGLLKPALEGPGRKPVLASTTGTINGASGKASGIASVASFAQWYDENAPKGTNTLNKTAAKILNLYLNADKTAYVNRFGNNGDGLTSAPYQLTTFEQCGQVGKEDHTPEGDAIPCTVCYYDPDPSTPQCEQKDTTRCQKDSTFIECQKNGTEWRGIFLKAAYDGNPLFFPADSLQPYSPSVTAQISGNYNDSWPEMPGNHNFSFTTEVRYWFKYDSSKTYKLTFVGDDDVWVFMNNKLAVDLGGIHTAVKGELTFGGAGNPTAVVSPTNVKDNPVSVKANPNLGFENGKVYEVVVLHAERQTKASSYQLTLSGFSGAASECSPRCGDGIVGIGEECDDGVNDGGYGECGKDCRLGEYCGDGIQQEGEDCDDGVNVGSPCPSGCRKLILL
jgi:fibro-slime domain-containing protein